MILSAYVTDSWLSYLVVDKKTLNVEESGVVKYPYSVDPFTSKLTRKKLLSYLAKPFKSYISDKANIVLSSTKKTQNNIEYDYTVQDLLKDVPFSPMIIDHYSNDSYRVLEEHEIDKYVNYKSYKLDIPYEQKRRLDLAYVMKYVPENIEKLLDIEEVVVMTVDVPAGAKKKYIEVIIRAFSNSIKITGIWKFSLDDRFSMIPLLGALKRLNVDLADFFEKNPMYSSGKLIIAPGVQECAFSKEKKGEEEIFTLKKNGINVIPLDKAEHMWIKWKSPKSKFEGLVYGSDIGLLIDTREINEK